MSLRACMEAHTHREYLVWMAWLEKEWNEPSRTDYQLMRIAQRILQSQSTTPKKINLEDQRVDFKMVKKQPPKKEDKQTIVDRSKSAWMGFVNRFKGNK